MNKKLNILYGINCTGQGHISRARCIVPQLKKAAHVDVLLSGMKQKVDLPFKHKFKRRGISFVYSKGKVNWKKTITKNNLFKLFQDTFTLSLKAYDFVVTDFEPITTLACFLQKKQCIHISHQISFLSPLVPRPEKCSFSEKIAHWFMTSQPHNEKIGLHYFAYDNYIFPPIKKEKSIHEANPSEHVCVYFPAFSKKDILNCLHQLPNTTFHLFHHNVRENSIQKNVSCFPLSQKNFLNSFKTSKAYMSHAGFESTSEALTSGKPLLCIPIKAQYEQRCNSYALKKLGVTVLESLNPTNIQNWLNLMPNQVKLDTCSSDDIAKQIIKLGTKHFS